MKTRNLLLAGAAISLMAVSCAGGGEKPAETSTEPTTETTQAVAANWVVDTESSNIRWEGNTAGAQVYGHFGNISIKEGKLSTEGSAITGGSFVVDMTTIDPKDENYSEEHPASDLVGHLSTGDFFLVEEHPTSSFVVKSVEGNKVVGDLTVKGATHEETIELQNVEVSADGAMIKAVGSLTFDRQKYGVAWEHYLKDVVLSDDIKLEIQLVGKKA